MTTTASMRSAERTQEPGTDPAIRVRDLHCSYGDFEAVRGVDLDVHRGEIFALLGANGAGKTTTLEVFEGYHRAAAGQVSILGADPWRDRDRLRRDMGIMLQEGGFINELTTGETLRLWGQMVSRDDRPERLLARFELEHRAEVAVGRLSGGEKRRLELAMAVWGTPSLVILDEPTTGLDPEARRRTWDAIQEIAEAGRTVVLTTHYLEEAEALADRIAIMSQGRIAISGTLAEIVATRPASFSARVGHAADLPVLDGAVETTREDGATRITVTTTALQDDLTRFLNWAAARGERLTDLRAAPASLADTYHAVREAELSEQETS